MHVENKTILVSAHSAAKRLLVSITGDQCCRIITTRDTAQDVQSKPNDRVLSWTEYIS